MKKEKILKIILIILIVLLVITIVIYMIGKRKANNDKIFDINTAIEMVEKKYNVLNNSITYVEEDNEYIIYGQDKDKHYRMFVVDKKTKLITDNDVSSKSG